MDIDELARKLREHRRILGVIYFWLGEAADRCMNSGSYGSAGVPALADKLSKLSGHPVSAAALYKAANVVRVFGKKRLEAGIEAGIPWHKLIRCSYSEDPLGNFKKAMNTAGKARRAQSSRKPRALQKSRSRGP